MPPHPHFPLNQPVTAAIQNEISTAEYGWGEVEKKPKTAFCRTAFVAVECRTGVTAEPVHKREVWDGWWGGCGSGFGVKGWMGGDKQTQTTPDDR